jgi:hypothetical protein
VRHLRSHNHEFYQINYYQFASPPLARIFWGGGDSIWRSGDADRAGRGARRAGKAANRYFSEQGAAYLPAEEAVFIANIYGMPGIGRLFAMPKMRKYPHRIMIADEEGLLDFLPQENGVVTVFELNEIGGIESIIYWDPSSDVTPF